MKTEAVLQALIDYRIDLAPVLDRTGIILWTAAVVELAADGWANSVSEKDFAQGDSPEEAVAALVAKLRRRKPVEAPALKRASKKLAGAATPKRPARGRSAAYKTRNGSLNAR